MLPDGTIQAVEVWKRFRADAQRSLLRDQAARLGRRLRREHDPNWRWALSDISLSVAPGESVGLVGSNGSGKSTLLKILTEVMYPSAGTVAVRGRVGALIEVRAGIHPDLTGRENVNLYGSLIGLSRRQIAARFDEIVAFAELEDAIDRQLKFYSSGMGMRLGFGVAAFLEPDILLVDEVLSVGDASFQQRCLDRMRYVLSQGTTLVFVSHDLAAVEATCARGLWLDYGVVEADGPVREVLTAYRGSVEADAEAAPRSTGPIGLLKVSITGPEGGSPATGHPAEVTLVVETASPFSARMCIGVSEGTASPVFLVGRRLELGAGESEIRCTLGDLPLPRGRYFLWAAAYQKGIYGPELLGWHPVAHFDVRGPELDPAPRAVLRPTPVFVEARWDVSSR